MLVSRGVLAGQDISAHSDRDRLLGVRGPGRSDHSVQGHGLMQLHISGLQPEGVPSGARPGGAVPAAGHSRARAVRLRAVKCPLCMAPSSATSRDVYTVLSSFPSQTPACGNLSWYFLFEEALSAIEIIQVSSCPQLGPPCCSMSLFIF